MGKKKIHKDEFSALPAMDTRKFRDFLPLGAVGVAQLVEDALLSVDRDDRAVAQWLTHDLAVIVRAAAALASGRDVELSEDDPGLKPREVVRRVESLLRMLAFDSAHEASKETEAARGAIRRRIGSEVAFLGSECEPVEARA